MNTYTSSRQGHPSQIFSNFTDALDDLPIICKIFSSMFVRILMSLD